MTLKSLWRSMKYASGPEKTYRDQRLRLIEAVNHCCLEMGAYVVVGNGPKPAVLQNYLEEDDIGDRILCDIEAVKFLNFRCFVFGHNFEPADGSLIERLLSYKVEMGIAYEEAGKECSRYRCRLDYRLSEGITIPQYRGKPVIYTWSPFQIHEKLHADFRTLESYQEQTEASLLTNFVLEREYRTNFDPENRVFRVLKRELRPRVSNEELQALWDSIGSDHTNSKISHAPEDQYKSGYDDDLFLRSGVPGHGTKAHRE